jgi:prepilin-type processing-associated H-X9-DG protein/prepilin-type N-terminal cleavage/methylation domain-containing protein
MAKHLPRLPRAEVGRSVRPLPGAFTMIEILVVVAIIAVLAAIAFPVAAKALESAQGSKCLSNLRQMHTPVASYMQDNNGHLPTKNPFVTSLWSYVYPERPMPKFPAKVLPPDLKGTIFECPTAVRDGSTRSYGFNGYMGDGVATNSEKFVRLDRPLSKICLIADCAESSNLVSTNITARHKNKSLCNVLYADGHVAPTTITPEIRQDNYSDDFWGRYK